MSDFILSCNVQNCRKQLNDVAYVTHCLHIFCDEHIVILNQKNSLCSVCKNIITEIKKVNCNPTENSKTLMLAGFKPDLITEVARRGLIFWNYQISMHQQSIKDDLKMAQENIDIMRSYIDNLHSQFKIDIAARDSKIETLKRELEMSKKRCNDVVEELHKTKNDFSKLQLESTIQQQLQQKHNPATHNSRAFTYSTEILKFDNRYLNEYSDNLSYLRVPKKCPLFESSFANDNLTEKEKDDDRNQMTMNEFLDFDPVLKDDYYD